MPDQKGGLILVLSKVESTTRQFITRALPEGEAAGIIQVIGGSIAKVKSPKDATAKVAPRYPFSMRKRGEAGRAACLFEVSEKGLVGRVFKVGEGSDAFFEECVRALEQWRFPKRSTASYRIIEFVAEYESNEPRGSPTPAIR